MAKAKFEEEVSALISKAQRMKRVLEEGCGVDVFEEAEIDYSGTRTSYLGLVPTYFLAIRFIHGAAASR